MLTAALIVGILAVLCYVKQDRCYRRMDRSKTLDAGDLEGGCFYSVACLVLGLVSILLFFVGMFGKFLHLIF